MLIDNDDGTTHNTHDPDRQQLQREYLVQWEIEISADTPEEAVRQAIEIMRERNSLATHFQVEDYAAQVTGTVPVRTL